MENHPPSTPLLVFSDDWGRHPSSCQHLIRHLLPQHPVWWVNTIGTRKPNWSFNTLKRGFAKLGEWCFPSTSIPRQNANPIVLSPRMWPTFASFWSRSLNRWLLERALRPVIRAMPEAPVALTTIPLVADLIGHLPVRRWVYYCVDDFTQWPGYDGETLRLMETSLITRVDRRIAVSQHLVERFERLGQPSTLLTHGIDPDFWQPQQQQPVPELTKLPRPIYLFWGLIDQRMEEEWVAYLASRINGQGSIVLVGPEAEPAVRLRNNSSLHFTGAVPIDRLPHFAQVADVLVMPYRDIPATQAMQPLKLKEYLATGKPVVVRDLPATREWAEALDLAATAEEFAGVAQRRATEGLPPSQMQARERLQSESWATKAQLLRNWMLQESA